MVPDVCAGEDNSMVSSRPTSVTSRRPLTTRSVDAPAPLLPWRAPRTRHSGHRHTAILRTPGSRSSAPADVQTHLSSLPPSTSLGSASAGEPGVPEGAVPLRLGRTR
jgi:hypothetical protein